MTKQEYIKELCKEENQKFLFKYVSKYIFGKANIEDIVQNTNVKIIEKYSSYKSNNNFKGWVSAIAFWTFQAYKKKIATSKVVYCEDVTMYLKLMSDNNHSMYANNINYSYASQSNIHEIQSDEIIKKIKLIVSTKSSKFQEVFNLSLEGHNPKEISKITGIKIENVYKTKARIMLLLRKKLGRKRSDVKRISI